MRRRGDILLVKFPFAESKGYKWRPALVLSDTAFHKRYGLCWVAMITSADNPPWPGDIVFSSLDHTGLDAPSVIRPAKLASLQIDKTAKIGKAAPSLCEQAAAFIAGHLTD